jgi:hypothetical protein
MAMGNRYSKFGLRNEWGVHGIRPIDNRLELQMTGGLTDPATSSRGWQYPWLEVSCTLSRKPSAYVWNFMVPMAIFSTLVAASWAADPSALQDRLAITLNMLLTGVAFKYAASQGLPKIA